MLRFSKFSRYFLNIVAVFALLACSAANAPVGGPPAGVGGSEGPPHGLFAGGPLGGPNGGSNNLNGDDQANTNASPTSGAGFPDPAMDVGHRSDLTVDAKTVECTFPPEDPSVTFEVSGRVTFPNNPEIQLEGRVFRIVFPDENTYMDRTLDADGHFDFQVSTDIQVKMHFFLLHKSVAFSGHEEKIPCTGALCSPDHKRDLGPMTVTNPCLPDTPDFHLPPGGKLPDPPKDNPTPSSSLPTLQKKP